MSNYDRIIQIISKWPCEPQSKYFNYGHFLRQSLKNKNLQGDIFPGSHVENQKKIESLSRLVSNVFMRKYPVGNPNGASRVPFKDLKMALSEEFIDYYNKRNKYFGKF